MDIYQTQNVNIEAMDTLISPAELKAEVPAPDIVNTMVFESRKHIRDIINKEDRRLLMIVGPCSIHDPKAALEYARRLTELRKELGEKLYIVMRVYFEKPRTTIGWKGLINDPDMNGSYDVPKGLRIARELLIRINEMGMPTATEMLDPISPQYLAGLISWASIGARTTESQTHREMASGLSMPVGFKNSTDGSVDVAIAAMQAAQHRHSFIGIDQKGHTSIVRTKGNPQGHLILRGGHKAPNYYVESIESAVVQLRAKGLCDRVMVDCSHANSGKKHERQEVVLHNVVDQIKEGSPHILGMMLESNLFEGSQAIPEEISKLKYGVSVTDACIGWDTTEKLLRSTFEAIS